MSCCDLLAWTVICVSSRRCPFEPGLLVSLSGPFSRLLWSVVGSVPQNYHVVKALCLLCTWPLPTTSQKSDQTFMLSGLMMQIAMQLGLHRPVQPEEFTTFKMEVRGEELKDRLHTWVICNLVAQKYVHLNGSFSSVSDMRQCRYWLWPAARNNIRLGTGASIVEERRLPSAGGAQDTSANREVLRSCHSYSVQRPARSNGVHQRGKADACSSPRE